MPQIFQVLRCFKCLVFQVHQMKKSNKFSCKMCGEKQSVKRHYGLGTGQECRLQVQKLNGLRGELDGLSESLQSKLNNDSDEEEISPTPKKTMIPKNKSKWSNYIDEDNELKELKPDEPMYLDEAEVVLEVPKKVKRFVKPKPAKRSIEVQTYNSEDRPNRVPWLVPWPLKNKIGTTEIKNESVETTAVINSQINSVVNIKHRLCEENIIQSVPKPKKTNVFELPKLSKQSKWAQFTENDDEKENNSDELEHDDILDENNDYVEENDKVCSESVTEVNTMPLEEKYSQESNEISKSSVQSHKTNKDDVKTNIFSTCDESELDSILDF